MLKKKGAKSLWLSGAFWSLIMRKVERRYRAASYAYSQVARAIKMGSLLNLKTTTILCSMCKIARAVEYDHRDYGSPLVVRPVCRKCNRTAGPANLPSPLHPMSKVGRPRKEPTESIYCRLPRKLLRSVRRKATDEGRLISTTIRLILEGALAQSGPRG